MKTLWVAVVLSFVSVGQPAPLTCNKLAKPVEKHPDLSGRWHFIAVSTEDCFRALLINNMFWPSVVVDVTNKSTPNHYAASIKVKMQGFCVNGTDDYFQENHKIFNVNSTADSPDDEPYVLLQTSCSDCIILKAVNSFDTVSLLSKRPNVTEEELKEFEMQVQCLDFSKPQVLNAEHDYENCQYVKKFTEDQAITLYNQAFERVKNTHQSILKCLVDMLIS